MDTERVNWIHEDHEKTLWFGTSIELFRLKDDQFIAYTTREGLANNYIHCVYGDAQGNLWIGTGAGINRLRNGVLTGTIQDGIFHDGAYVILEDVHGNFWMSRNKGVFSASKQALSAVMDGRAATVMPTVYGTADGMRSGEANGGTQSSGWKSRDGRIWFPTLKGVIVIDPNHSSLNQHVPPVVIEQVLVDGKPIAIDEKVALPEGSEKLEFHYTALSFIAPDKVKFKYLLEGFDKNWIDADTRRVAFYTNIRPGKYRFRVIACNNDGLWNETVRHLVST